TQAEPREWSTLDEPNEDPRDEKQRRDGAGLDDELRRRGACGDEGGLRLLDRDEPGRGDATPREEEEDDFAERAGDSAERHATGRRGRVGGRRRGRHRRISASE